MTVQEIAELLQSIVNEEFQAWQALYAGSQEEGYIAAMDAELHAKWYPEEDGTYKDPRFDGIRAKFPYPPYHYLAEEFLTHLIERCSEKDLQVQDPLYPGYRASNEYEEEGVHFRVFLIKVVHAETTYYLKIAFSHLHDELGFPGPPLVSPL